MTSGFSVWTLTDGRSLRQTVASLALLLVVWSGGARAASQQAGGLLIGGESECGSLDNGSTGPYDYRDHSPYIRTILSLVNRVHFTAGVRNLKGQTTVYVIGDLDYTLRVFPNHYPGLQVMSKYYLQGGDQMDYRSAECYFDRAMRFVPDDAQVHQLYAFYLSKKGRLPEAIAQMEIALDLSPDPPMELHYNMGLLYADARDYVKANYHASVAYAQGYPLPGLRQKLQRLGQWQPVAVPNNGGATPPTDPAPGTAAAQTTR